MGDLCPDFILFLCHFVFINIIYIYILFFFHILLHKIKKKAGLSRSTNQQCLAVKITAVLSPAFGTGLDMKLIDTIWPRLFFIS